MYGHPWDQANVSVHDIMVPRQRDGRTGGWGWRQTHCILHNYFIHHDWPAAIEIFILLTRSDRLVCYKYFTYN